MSVEITKKKRRKKKKEEECKTVTTTTTNNKKKKKTASVFRVDTCTYVRRHFKTTTEKKKRLVRMPYINALADLRLPIAFIEYTWFEPMANGVGVKARHFFFFFNYALNNPPPFSSLFQTTSSFSFFNLSFHSLS